MREQAKRQMIIGLVIAGVGTLVTVASYASANGGGTYLVLWGAIVFGLIRAARGANAYFSSKQPVPTSDLVAHSPAADGEPPIPARIDVPTPPLAGPPEGSVWS